MRTPADQAVGNYGGYAGGVRSNTSPYTPSDYLRNPITTTGQRAGMPPSTRPASGPVAARPRSSYYEWWNHDYSSARVPAYARPEVKEAVNTLLGSKPSAATAADTASDYGAEYARIQKLINEQQRLAKAEKDAQLALAKRERKSAYDRVAKEWERHGLDGKEIKKALQGLAEGDYLNADTMTERVRETKTWANRFGAVVNARQKKGLSFLNEGEIKGLEDQYRAIMSSANMPKGFYNSHKDFQHWIANDVSPKEIGERVSLAEKAIANADPDYIKAMKQFYGVKRSDLAAYMLDRKRGVEVLEQQLKAVELKAEANATGIGISKSFTEQLVDKDISRQEARQAFDQVAQTSADWQRLAGLSRESLTEQSLVEAELSLDPETGVKKKRLASQERSRWGGSGGSSGAFGASRSGSY